VFGINNYLGTAKIKSPYTPKILKGGLNPMHSQSKLLRIILLITIIITIFGTTGSTRIQAATYAVSSPDSAIQATIDHNTGTGAVSYSVSYSGTTVINSSPLGINTSYEDFTTGLSYSGNSTTPINENYTLPGRKKATYTNNCNELTLTFTKNSKQFQIIFRAYNDGIAYRYYIPGSGNLTVNSESSTANFNGFDRSWSMDSTADSYEDQYDEVAGSSWSGTLATRTRSAPILVKLANHWSLISEAANYGDFCVSKFYHNSTGGSFKYQYFNSSFGTSLPLSSPWRVTMLGTGLAALVESALFENLNNASEISDTSWILPGRASWAWSGGENDYWYTRKQSIQKEFIDFSARMGWEYFLVDWNWDASDADINVADLCTYGAGKNVKILLWSNSSRFRGLSDTQIYNILNTWKGWGVKGIKVDFFTGDSVSEQKLMQSIILQAKTLQMTVNFHGVRRPSGEIRRWPNFLASEGIYGAEYHWVGTSPDARHVCTVPFTRNLTGAMDFTPCEFDLNVKGSTTYTWGNQVAQPVVFSSYILHYADHWKNFDRVVAAQLFRTLPVVWDDTRLIEGYPGSYVTMARKSGNDWYLGTVCDGTRTLNITLSFLNPGTTYYAQIYKDGNNDQSLIFEEKTVTSTSILNIPLRAKGGAAVYFATADPALPMVNLAQSGIASADSQNSSGETPDRALDGSFKSLWQSANTTGAHWLMVDLGASKAIKRWIAKHDAWGINWNAVENTNYNTRDFKLQVSNDGTNWTDIDSVTGNSANLTDRLVNSSGRYVRLYVTNPNNGMDSAARIRELEIYDVNGPTSTPTPTPVPTTPTPSPPGPKLSGTAFGTSPAFASGCEYDKASDGNTSTYFDYVNPDGGYTGIDLGAGNAKQVIQIRYFPRAAWSSRMNGGKFQGSNTASDSGYTDLYTVSTTPPEGQWTVVSIGDSNTYRYLRYLGPTGSYGNIAEMEFYTEAGGSGDPEVTGTIIGTAGSYNNLGDTIDKAVDGNTATAFDAPEASKDYAWVGYDFGGGDEKVITKLRYYPRASWASRMVGGKFQGSNNSGFSPAVDLYTVSSQPPYSYTEVTISNSTAFRYVRYLAPANGYGNIAEVDFYGHGGTGATATPTLTPTPTPTPTFTPTPTPTPTAGPGNDEFNNSTLDPGWSWVREDNTKWSLTANPGYMRITIQSGDIYSTNTNNMKNILLKTPQASDFTLTTKLTLDPAANYQQAGLLVYTDDDNYINVQRKYSSGKKFSIIKEVAGVPTEISVTDTAGATIYLKLVKSGTTYNGYYSTDGTNWISISSFTGVSLTSPKIGLFAGSSATGRDADFDWVHVN
jgi:alpha-glucosidase